jgi:gamma-glutamylcyclotransferase (GGCT)/AIG2-like uncharacterized protein YtfP
MEKFFAHGRQRELARDAGGRLLGTNSIAACVIGSREGESLLRPGVGVFPGELWNVPSATLRRLDALESSLHRRKVRCASGEHAWVYMADYDRFVQPLTITNLPSRDE